MVPLNLIKKVKTNEIMIQPKEISLKDLLGSKICYMESGLNGKQRKIGLVRYNRTDEVIYINWEDGTRDTCITLNDGSGNPDPEGTKVLELSYIV